MFSPSDRFSRSPDVVLRRFPEWRQCFAYTSARPDLYELNSTAWLIVELCEGQQLVELEGAFVDVVGRKTMIAEGLAHLHHGLRELLDRGIIVRQSQAQTDERSTRGGLSC
jgi:hypothetical protein